VSKPIRVHLTRVKTKEHVHKKGRLTHVNVGSVGIEKHVKQKHHVTEQLVMDMGNAVVTVII
jgi:hypothetical protein